MFFTIYYLFFTIFYLSFIIHHGFTESYFILLVFCYENLTGKIITNAGKNGCQLLKSWHPFLQVIHSQKRKLALLDITLNGYIIMLVYLFYFSFYNFILNFDSMRKLFLLILSITLFANAKSAITNQIHFDSSNRVSIKKDDNPASNSQLIAKMSIKQIERYLGRKLKFKEKITTNLLKYKIKHGLKSKDEIAGKKGKNALTLGILAIVTLFLFPLATIPLGILAITNGNQALKLNPNDKNAKTAITLGIISLSFILLAIIAIIAILSYYPFL
jgi:hypothetical protein